MVENKRAEEVVRTEMTPVVEPGGQNPDNLVRFAIDPDNVANDVVSAAEALLPATLADDNDTIVSWNVFSRQEIGRASCRERVYACV